MAKIKPGPTAVIDSTNADTTGLILMTAINQGSGATISNLVDASTATIGAGWVWGTGPTGCVALVGNGTQASTAFTPSSPPTDNFTVIAIGQANTGGPYSLFQQDSDVGTGIDSTIGWGALVTVNSASTDFGNVGGGQYNAIHGNGTGRVIVGIRRVSTVMDFLTAGATAATTTVLSAAIRGNIPHKWQIGFTDGDDGGGTNIPIPLNGTIEMVAMWNIALSDAAIARIAADPWALLTAVNAPANPTATPGVQSVVVSCDAYPAATGYDIYQVNASQTEDLTTPTYANVSIPYTVSCADPAKGYYFKIIAITPCGRTGPSVETQCMPTAMAPATNFTAVASEDYITLAWTASADATSYTLYRRTPATSPATSYKTGLTGTSYTDTAVEEGTTYIYSLYAVDACGSSTPTLEVQATPQCCLNEFQSGSTPASTAVSGSTPAITFTGGSTPADTSTRSAC